MKWMLKIKAGALQFVLFIGVVIILLLLTFVSLSHAHALFGKKTDLLIHTIKRTNLGLDYAMKTNMGLYDTIPLQIQLEDQIELKGVKEFWGVFEKYTVVSTSKKNRFVKSALVGKSIVNGLPALYLKDNKRPMIIAGDAQITGDVFLPEQGIRPGNIAGNSFYGSTMVSGRRQESSSQLPKLNSTLRQHIEGLSNNSFPKASDEVLSISNGMVLANSFKMPTKIIYGETINLSGVSLTGNIIVKAGRKIIVDPSSYLKDVVLLAPEISIRNKVVGSFQAIAEEQITVGKNCNIGYPSALVVSQKSSNTGLRNKNQVPNIFVDSKTLFKGIIAYLGTAQEQQFSPQIKINDNSTIWGELYCEQNLELKGEVIGSVTTNAFMALEGGSIYQNHLYNGKINSRLLPPQYVGFILEGENEKKEICKWLY